MSDRYRTGQGTVIPTLFVGVGGTGSRIVDRIASRAAHLPNWETQLRPLVSFVSIDTNELDQHKLRAIPEGNRLNIAAFDKAKVIEHFRRSREAQALQWLDPAYQPRPGFKPGAGQIRVESRLGFYYHSPQIRQRLEVLVRDSLQPGITWRQQSPPKFNVYLFCTLAGGTGSGSFLPTAYLLSDVIQHQGWQPRVVGNLLLSTLMTDQVGPELHPDIHANTYAALKELEHLTKLDYPQIKREGRTSEPFVFCRDENSRELPRVTTRPFFLGFIFDRAPHLGLTHIDRVIADAAFLQIFTPIIDNMAGELDNYEKNLEELTRFPGEFKHVGRGYSKNFGAFGAVAMVLPGEDLLEYSALRFAAQAIRGQITFGLDPSDAADDRARALARYAVNYSDPKFLHMSDEGRQQAIHQAFVDSVQEMARQDRQQGLEDGFWLRLVESVDEGPETGTDDAGKPIRGESLVDAVARKLGAERQALMDRVSIKERAFVFHKEGVNQYVEEVSRLLEDIRKARQMVGEGSKGLTAAALEGEVVAGLRLDPIAERYLVLRLLERCEGSWLPEGQKQLDKVLEKDVSNPKVRERLERELYDSLKEAAASRRFFGKDQAFLDVRDEAQQYYSAVAAAARKTLVAETELQQLRALQEFLRRRARQYAQLATRMDALVEDLEIEAERLRRGELAIEPGYSLRVEVFETLEEPRQRIWRQVFASLFLDGGRYLATFDRRLLANAITRELRPIVRGDGTVAEKPLDRTVSDLRRSLTELGRERLRPAIFGGEGQAGLDLVRGLDLEARLRLAPGKRAGEEVTRDEIEEYRDRKFRALAQIAGVLARVSSAESRALDDGVKSNRTRQLIWGVQEEAGGRGAEHFLGRLQSILEGGGRQVKVDTWHDPRLLIVHDVELPIPLYYLPAVVGEIEQAYLKLAADASRSYKLHTDFHWEESLPNLNPRSAEITVGWSLRMLAEGLVTRAIGISEGHWIWHRSDGEGDLDLGDQLSTALYRLSELHSLKTLHQILEDQMREARTAGSAEEFAERRQQLMEQIRKIIADLELRQSRAALRSEEALDRPIYEALQAQIGQVPAAAEGSLTAGPERRLTLE